MANNATSEENSRLTRRRALQLIGVTGAVSTAGCLGGGDDDNGDDGDDDGTPSEELGERVPSVVVAYWTDAGGGSTIHELAVPIAERGWEELGIDIEISRATLGGNLDSVANDVRDNHISFWFSSTSGDRLDPNEYTRRWAIDWAGEGRGSNPSNYASCEFSYPAINQQFAETEEERRELVYEAQEIFTAEMPSIPIGPSLTYGAARTDTITPDSIDALGSYVENTYFYIDTEPAESGKDNVISSIDPTAVETTNFPTLADAGSRAIIGKFVHSPLLDYDSEANLVEMLAESYEVEENGRRITFELRDATFHNGDPITAEDVEFTYTQLDAHPGVYPRPPGAPTESINILDERTIEFNFTEPFLPFISNIVPQWGILHKETWEDGGAVENPEDFELDPAIGSGPFELDSLNRGQSITLTPHDGHPIHNPDHNLIFVAYADPQAAYQAFINAEIDILTQMGPSQIEQVENDLGDDGLVLQGGGALPVYGNFQMPRAPIKFHAIREAMGMAINRQEIADVAFFGAIDEIPLDAGILRERHPWRAPADRITNYTDDLTGDIDGARDVLEEAGFGWDSDGNLHYPPGADTNPLWPEGSNPSPDDFPCLDDFLD